MYSSYTKNLQINPANIDDVSQKKINKFKIVRLAKAGAAGAGYWFSGELEEDWRTRLSGVTISNKVIPVLDNNCISFSISQEFDSFWDKVTGNQAVQLIDKVASAARMFSGKPDQRIHVSKYVKMPVLKAVGPIQISSSLKFNFYFGQAGLYDGLEEVVKPIIAIASTFMPGGNGWGNAPSTEWALSVAVRDIMKTFANEISSKKGDIDKEKRILSTDPKFSGPNGEYYDPQSPEYATAYMEDWKAKYDQQNPDSTKSADDAWKEAVEKNHVPSYVAKNYTNSQQTTHMTQGELYVHQGQAANAAAEAAANNSSSGNDKANMDLLKDTWNSSDGIKIIEKVAAGLSGLQNKIYEAIDHAGGEVAQAYKGCRIQIGRYVTPSFLVKDVSWDFDFTNIDQNGFPTKGSVTLGGLESIVAGGGGMIGNPPNEIKSLSDGKKEAAEDKAYMDNSSTEKQENPVTET